jgi:hypothetical protein
MFTPHPFGIAADINSFGYTYVYWDLRNNYNQSRIGALWLLWVAHQYNRHIHNRSILTDIVD